MVALLTSPEEILTCKYATVERTVGRNICAGVSDMIVMRVNGK